MTLKYPLIALTGYGRSGKDEVAKTLIAAGYNRSCIGDVIKRQLDTVIQRHLGFSAFTEIDEQKALIRPLLEQWGEINYDNILAHYFKSLPNPCINTRLIRVREAHAWIERGGIIVEVIRAGNAPETQWAAHRLLELRCAGVIHRTIPNYGTLEDLATTVIRELL